MIQHAESPTAASIDWPAANMARGVAPITSTAHATCLAAKQTRFSRTAADSCAARRAARRAATRIVRPGADLAALLPSGGMAHKRRRQIDKTQKVLQALPINDVFAPKDVRGDRVADLKRQ